MVLPYSGCYENFFYVCSTDTSRGSLVMENCVFSSKSTSVKSYILKIPESLKVEVNITGLVIDGITFTDYEMMYFFGPDCLFSANSMKVINVINSDSKSLILDNLDFVEDGVYQNCEFCNVCFFKFLIIYIMKIIIYLILI
jgi:hypothetical protein